MIPPSRRKEPIFFFQRYREFNGKKFQYGGEYPYDKDFLKNTRKSMKSIGYDIYFQFNKTNKKVIIWTRKVKWFGRLKGPEAWTY